MHMHWKAFFFCFLLNISFLSFSFWQGVFINPAFIEPFGLTLIEVLFVISIKNILFMLNFI